MNKGNGFLQRTAAFCAAVLLLSGAALPVFAEPDAEPADVPAAAEENPNPDAQTETTDVTADTTAEETTGTTAEITTVVHTEMTPPDPLTMIRYEAAEDGGICITSFRWTCEETVEIPPQIEGKPVTEIGAEAFKYCYADAVALPDTVKKIGARAFEGCAYLQAMPIPKSCVSIGDGAFSGCKMLGNVILPETVREIGREAFAETAYLNGQLGDAVILGSGILYDYRGTDTAYTVPADVKIIGAEAFAGAESLRKITIPQSVTQIQQGAFAGCTALAEIEAPDTFTSLAADAFADTKWLTDSKEDFLTLGKMLIAYQGKESTVEVPEGIQVINAGAFAGNNGITALRLPESVREIRSGACSGCASLQVAEFGDALTAIGDDAFLNCSTLNYLRLGHALETVGDRAFAGCPRLTEVYLPDTVKTLGEKAFGYSFDGESGFRRLKNELVLYSNTGTVREYADAEGIAHEPLPDAENTEPAPIVTEPENASPGFGTIRGKAWIPAAGLGGVLVLAGFIRFVMRKRRNAAD